MLNPNITIRNFGTTVSTIVEIESRDRPQSNDEALQGALFDLHIAKELSTIGDRMKKEATKFLKSTFEETTKQVGDHGIVASSNPVELQLKVANPRETFDKAAFIREVSQKYDISARELQQLAGDCTKQSAAPVSFVTHIQAIAGSSHE